MTPKVILPKFSAKMQSYFGILMYVFKCAFQKISVLTEKNVLPKINQAIVFNTDQTFDKNKKGQLLVIQRLSPSVESGK